MQLRQDNDYDIHIFDFDLTLTKLHTYDQNANNMTDSEIYMNVMPHILEVFRAIWAANPKNKIAIVSRNEFPDLIKKHLEAAFLSKNEVNPIQIVCAGNSKKGHKPDWVAGVIESNLKKNPNLKNVYNYDDEDNYLNAAERRVKTKFPNASFNFHKVHVNPAGSTQHLHKLKIQQQKIIAEKSSQPFKEKKEHKEAESTSFRKSWENARKSYYLQRKTLFGGWKKISDQSLQAIIKMDNAKDDKKLRRAAEKYVEKNKSRALAQEILKAMPGLTK